MNLPTLEGREQAALGVGGLLATGAALWVWGPANGWVAWLVLVDLLALVSLATDGVVRAGFDRIEPDDPIRHPRKCGECGAKTYQFERCHSCGDKPWAGGST